jgi:hypothetical protein
MSTILNQINKDTCSSNITIEIRKTYAPDFNEIEKFSQQKHWKAVNVLKTYTLF